MNVGAGEEAQGIWVQFPASIEWLILSGNSFPGGSSGLLSSVGTAYMWCIYTHAVKILMHVK